MVKVDTFVPEDSLLPEFFVKYFDCHQKNFGMLDGNLVCLDYGTYDKVSHKEMLNYMNLVPWKNLRCPE